MSLKVVFANKFTEVTMMAVKYDMQLHRFIFIDNFFRRGDATEIHFTLGRTQV